MDSAIVVVSNTDGKKFKMVMKGDVGMLSVEKIKRYLQEATKLEPARQILRFNGVVLYDGMLGAQIGLYDGAVMFLDAAPVIPQAVMAPVPSYPLFQQQQQQQMQMHTPQHSNSFQNVSAMTIAPSPIVGARSSSIGTTVVDFAARPVYVDHRTPPLEREQRQRSEERRFQMERDLDAELTKLREMQRQVEGERGDMLRRESERLQTLRSREDDLEREAEHIRDERRRLDIVKASTEQEAARRLRDADTLSRRQQQEIEALQRELVQARTEAAAAARQAAALPPPPPAKVSPEECVARSLDILAQDFRLPRLVLDANYTCIINLAAEKVNLLVTFDPSTQRLFLYSTILSALPSDASVALQLYEAVLEGALLGRDMAGGGIGISAKNNLLLMSTSLDMRHADELALIAVTRPFVVAVQKWVEIVNGILRSSGFSP